MRIEKMKPFEVKVGSQYGAPMGRRSDNPANFDGVRTRLQCVPFYDYAYDKGGAYWGSGTPLYCAWSDDPESDSIVYYFRAKSRKEACEHMLEHGAKLLGGSRK